MQLCGRPPSWRHAGPTKGTALILCIVYKHLTDSFSSSKAVSVRTTAHVNMRHSKSSGSMHTAMSVLLFAGPKGLQQYIDTVRQGKGQNPKQYSARYICSLVGDFHRTLLYGGELQGLLQGLLL